NEVRANALFSSVIDGMDIARGSGQAQVIGNLFVANRGSGIDSAAGGGGNLYLDNTVSGNGIGLDGSPSAETSAIRLAATGNTLDRNVIRDNFGAGVLVPPAST